MKNKNLLQIIVVVFVILIILSSVIFGFFYVFGNSKIKSANQKMYDYLVCSKECEISYTFSPGTLHVFSFFDETCTADCEKLAEGIPFKPGELPRGKLIFESEEYSECLIEMQSGGADLFKSCIEKSLPIFEERYLN